MSSTQSYACGPSQNPGWGFPLMKLVGLFDLNSGAWLATVKRGRHGHVLINSDSHRGAHVLDLAAQVRFNQMPSKDT